MTQPSIPELIIGAGVIALKKGIDAVKRRRRRRRSREAERADEEASGDTRNKDDAKKCTGSCKTPYKRYNDRHDPCKMREGGMSRGDGKNTMIDPDSKAAIDQDISNIVAGKVSPKGDNFHVNGRTYGFHSDKTSSNYGTIFPRSGPGLVDLDRAQTKYLGMLNSNPEGAAKMKRGMLDNGIMSEDKFDEVEKLQRKCKR